MRDFALMTDSSCDLPQEIADKFDITVVSLIVTMDGKDYVNDLAWSSISSHEFYERLRNGAMAKTSAPSVDAFRSAMEPLLKAGKDILYIGFSTALSAAYNTGAMVAKLLMEEYPERKILTVDTLAASLGQGLLVYKTAEKIAAGCTLEEAYQYAEDTKLHICHWFTVGDLMFLKRGGRVSPTVAVIGSMLNIKPIMHMPDEGTLVPVTKVRGTKAYHAKIAELMNTTGINIKDQTVFISHGDCLDQVNALVEYLKTATGVQNFLINPVGPVIGAHSGPGTIAVFFEGTHR